MSKNKKYDHNSGNVAAQIVMTRNVIDSRYEDNLYLTPQELFKKKRYLSVEKAEIAILETLIDETQETFDNYKIDEEDKLSFIKILDFLNQKVILLQQVELLFMKSVCVKYGLDFGVQKAEYEKCIANDDGNPRRMDAFHKVLDEKKITLDKYDIVMEDFRFAKKISNIFSVLLVARNEKLFTKKKELEEEKEKLEKEKKTLEQEEKTLEQEEKTLEQEILKSALMHDIKKTIEELNTIEEKLNFPEVVKNRHLRPIEETSLPGSNFPAMARMPLNIDLDSKVSIDDENLREILSKASKDIEEMSRNEKSGVGKIEVNMMKEIIEKVEKSIGDMNAIEDDLSGSVRSPIMFGDSVRSSMFSDSVRSSVVSGSVGSPVVSGSVRSPVTSRLSFSLER